MSNQKRTARVATLLAFLVENPDVEFENVVISNYRVTFSVYFDTDQCEKLRSALLPNFEWASHVSLTEHVADRVEYTSDQTLIGSAAIFYHLDHRSKVVAA